MGNGGGRVEDGEGENGGGGCEWKYCGRNIHMGGAA